MGGWGGVLFLLKRRISLLPKCGRKSFLTEASDGLPEWGVGAGEVSPSSFTFSFFFLPNLEQPL